MPAHLFTQLTVLQRHGLVAVPGHAVS
jgi:hypothetical protein